jgi:hypothetical protein
MKAWSPLLILYRTLAWSNLISGVKFAQPLDLDMPAIPLWISALCPCQLLVKIRSLGLSSPSCILERSPSANFSRLDPHQLSSTRQLLSCVGPRSIYCHCRESNLALTVTFDASAAPDPISHSDASLRLVVHPGMFSYLTQADPRTS